MFKSLSLRARLLSCLGGVLLVAASVSAYSLRSIYGFRSQLRDEIEVGSARLDQARQIAIGLGSMRSSIRGIVLFSLTSNTAGFTGAKAAFQSSAGQMRDVLKSMDTNLSTEDRAAMEAIRSGLDEWVARFPEFVSLCESGKIEEANQFTLQKVSPIMDSIQKSASALGQANRTRHDAAIAKVDSSIEWSTLATLVLMGVVLLVSAGGFLIVSRLARSLRHAAEAVRSGAMQVLSASNEVASSSQYLAQGSSEQAASLEEAAASAEEISSMARKNTESSQAATDVAVRSGAHFAETNRSLDLMVVSMGEIKASGGKISKIIKINFSI